jgi:hypothetical protein
MSIRYINEERKERNGIEPTRSLATDSLTGVKHAACTFGQNGECGLTGLTVMVAKWGARSSLCQHVSAAVPGSAPGVLCVLALI